MGLHRRTESANAERTSAARPEPVAFAAVAQAVLAALVAIGWVHLDDATIATIVSAIAAVAAAVFALMARSKVTPISDPRLGTTEPLIPDPEE